MPNTINISIIAENLTRAKIQRDLAKAYASCAKSYAENGRDDLAMDADYFYAVQLKNCKSYIGLARYFRRSENNGKIQRYP